MIIKERVHISEFVKGNTWVNTDRYPTLIETKRKMYDWWERGYEPFMIVETEVDDEEYIEI